MPKAYFSNRAYLLSLSLSLSLCLWHSTRHVRAPFEAPEAPEAPEASACPRRSVCVSGRAPLLGSREGFEEDETWLAWLAWLARLAWLSPYLCSPRFIIYDQVEKKVNVTTLNRSIFRQEEKRHRYRAKTSQTFASISTLGRERISATPSTGLKGRKNMFSSPPPLKTHFRLAEKVIYSAAIKRAQNYPIDTFLLPLLGPPKLGHVRRDP